MAEIDWDQLVTSEMKAAQVRADQIARVKAEAQRRIIALTGASDLQSGLITQMNALMLANELNDKRISGGDLSPEEEAEADALRALADGIKAIRARSDVIEEMEPIPADVSDDSLWET